MNVLTGVLIVALLATVVVLVIGIGSMMRGRQFDQQHSHQLMFLRVGLHGLVAILILVAIYISVAE